MEDRIITAEERKLLNTVASTFGLNERIVKQLEDEYNSALEEEWFVQETTFLVNHSNGIKSMDSLMLEYAHIGTLVLRVGLGRFGISADFNEIFEHLFSKFRIVNFWMEL